MQQYDIQTGGNTPLAPPTGIQENDILIASFVFWATADLTPPTGWELHTSQTTSGNLIQYVYWKRATASEPSTYQWTWTGSKDYDLCILAYRGAIQSGSPFDCTPSSSYDNSASSLQIPQITIATSGAMAVGLIHHNTSATRGSTSDFDNERYDISDNIAYDKIFSTTGATGAFTITGSQSDSWTGIVLALKPMTPVEITGTPVVWKSSDRSASQAFTIPADAQAVIVIAEGELDNEIVRLTWDNSANLHFTQIAISNPHEWCRAFIMTSADANWPGAGAKTLYRYLDTGGAAIAGQVWLIFAVKNINVASPIGDTETYDSAAQPATFDMALTNVGGADMSVVASYSWMYESSDADPAGYGQTALLEGVNAAYNNNALTVGYEIGEDSLRITASYPRAIAFVIKATQAVHTVEKTGLVYTRQSTDSGSIGSITIPEDAEAAIFIVEGANTNSVAALAQELNWDDGDDNDFTLIEYTDYDETGYRQVEAWIMLSSNPNWPGAGQNKTLYFTKYGYNQWDGYSMAVFFVKGINKSEPIGDTDKRLVGGNWVSSLTGVGGGDMCVIAAYRWAGTIDIDPAGSG